MCCGILYDTAMIYRILQIVHDRITNQSFIATFFIEIACAIGFGYTRQTSNHKIIDYSLILHAAKVFHLEWFTMYGIWLARYQPICYQARKFPLPVWFQYLCPGMRKPVLSAHFLLWEILQLSTDYPDISYPEHQG